MKRIAFYRLLITICLATITVNSLFYTAAQTPIRTPRILLYSPDGSKIVGAGFGLLRVWNAYNQEVFFDFTTMSTTNTSSVSWRPDGKTLATSSDDQFIRIWNISDPNYSIGQLITEFQPYYADGDLVVSVDWSLDGQKLAIGGAGIVNGYTLKVFDANSFALLDQSAIGWAERIKWNPNGSANQVLVGYNGGGAAIVTLDGSSSRIVREVGNGNAIVTAIAWNGDGAKVVLGYENGNVLVWDASTNAQLAAMSGTDQNPIVQVAWSPDGNTIAAANAVVRVWNSSTGQLLNTLSNAALSVDFSPDGTKLAFGSAGATLNIISFPIVSNARPTLPPEWTLTPTATPAPPTATATLRPTFTPVPTLSAADICREFIWRTNFTEPDPATGGPQRFDGDGVLSVLATTPTIDLQVRFGLTITETGKTDHFDMPGGQMVGLNYLVQHLPQTGVYAWSLVVVSPLYGEICEQGGTLEVTSIVPSTATPTPTDTPSPEATAETTPD